MQNSLRLRARSCPRGFAPDRSGLGVLFLLPALLLALAFPAHALNPSWPPGRNFDLSHWYLGLPDEDASSISYSRLKGGYTNANWFYTGTDGAMVFYTPVTGGTTPNSANPRTELREQINSGDNSPNWTYRGTHLLEAQCKILQVPSSGQFWIGQIHGYLNTAPVLCLLRYDNGFLQLQVRTNPAVSGSIYLPLTNVGLNQMISYRIQFSDGILTASANGATQRLDVAQLNPAWTNQNFYFKAGSYCDDHDGPDTEGSRVAFYQLTVTHSPYSVPAITLQPVSQAAADGATVTFRTRAQSTGPLAFRWRKDGVNIPSATSSNLTFTNLTLAHAGQYSVTASNGAGTATSAAASLGIVVIKPPPVLAIQTGAGKVRLQWTAIPGGTYQVYARSELHEGGWSALPSPVVINGPLASCEDDVVSPQRFYRVTVE